jgi:hypothetical protein
MSFGFGFSLPAYTEYGGRFGAGSTLLLDFTSGNQTLDPRITFTRSTTATRTNSSGLIESVAINGPRFDYDPTTLAPLGLLIEEQRTNSIRNSTGIGAVAGTPGTVPTNWTAGITSNGLNREIVGTGIQSGVNYIDIRYYGTTSAATTTTIVFEAANSVSASASQAWANSLWVRLVGGTLPAGGCAITVHEFSNTNVFLRSNDALINVTSSWTRFNQSITIGVSTAFVRPILFFGYASGVPIDITLRIGLPQLELGAFATSVIPTTTAATTRTADVATMTGTNFSSWYNQSEGTLFAESSRFAPLATFGKYVICEGGNPAPNNNEVVQLGTQLGTSNFQFLVISGGVTQASIVEAGITASAKYAGAYKANNFAYTKNGATPQTDTSGVTATVSQFNIGSRPAFGNTGFLNGHIRRIAYFPRRLANSELQAITS